VTVYDVNLTDKKSRPVCELGSGTRRDHQPAATIGLTSTTALGQVIPGEPPHRTATVRGIAAGNRTRFSVESKAGSNARLFSCPCYR